MERYSSSTLVESEYYLNLSQAKEITIPEGTLARKGNKEVWPILTGISIAKVEIPIGKWRAPHYHTNTPELAVIVQGTARAGLITPQNEQIIVDLQEGDCVFFPVGWTHWLRNTGNIDVKTYFNYGHEQPLTVEVSNILAHFNAAEKDLSLKGHTKHFETE